MLAIGAAVGVSSNFGAPIGGVLFSIEVTAAYFVVPLYWKCFFTAVTGAVVARVLYSWWHLDPNNANRPHAAKIGLTSMPRAEWDELGLDTAPFTVQHCAPMSLVHFYFSQLTLNCVFVVERGRFVGMINKQDMHHADVV